MIRKRKGDIGKIKTTVTVKLATKHRLQDIASKGESFDQVINGLINKNGYLEIENENLMRVVNENDLQRNLIVSTVENKGVSAITLIDGTTIQFRYNKPDENIRSEWYEMDITIDKIFSKDGNVKDISEISPHADIRAYIKLLMVENVIANHFTRAFEIPNRGLAMDPRYWEGVWNRIGLSGHSYDHDIQPILSQYEDEMYD